MVPDDRGAVVLYPAKGKRLRRLLFSLALTGISIAMISSGEGIYSWFCAAIFAFASIGFAILLAPKASCLRLTREGFVFYGFFRPGPLITWGSVSEFRVKSIPAIAKVVVFDQPGAPDHQKLRRINRVLAGGEGLLPDTYGLTASELATLINDWRGRYAPQR